MYVVGVSLWLRHCTHQLIHCFHSYFPLCSDAANLRPVPAPRRRSHSLHRQGYENAEIVDLHKNGLLRMQKIHGEVPAGLRRQLSADQGTRQHLVVASGTHHVGSSSGSVSSDVDEYEPMSSLRREDDDYIVMKSASRSRPIEYEDMQSYPVGRERIEQYTVVTSPAQRCVHTHTHVWACLCTDTARGVLCAFMCAHTHRHAVVCVKMHKSLCIHVCRCM